MAKITAKEWRVLDNMETTPLLDVVDVIDRLRGELADSDGLHPPQIRDDFLRLHQLGMQVGQRGGDRVAEEFFELANDLDLQVSGLITALSEIQDTLTTVLDLYPESLSEPGAGDDGDDEEGEVDLDEDDEDALSSLAAHSTPV